MDEQRGQLSIFLGISVLLILTMMAFVINVGLFVKAKINLQNAVDAAAWAGAAVQARQLTNIAYLNWEMRNNYKEWMFKYYVLGQVSMEKTNVDSSGNFVKQPDDLMDFRRDLHAAAVSFRTSGGDAIYDRWNIPSVCIDVAGGNFENLCDLYHLPGVPFFPDSGLNIKDLSDEFFTHITEAKAKDCAFRTDLNFGVSMAWAYGIKGEDIAGDIDTPVASDREGAWVKALELALRMRNLEKIVNRPPEQQSICIGGSDCKSIRSLEGESPDLPVANERPIKAFLSAWRNLSGGIDKEKGVDVFSSSFRLTELSPTSYPVSPRSLSGFLIPASPSSNLEKHYLDLWIYPLNLATFFVNFSPSSSSYAAKGRGGASFPTGSDCSAIRMALPVPGFIFGFAKNPDVVTYYAVKGEANYIGLLYPFSDKNGVKLHAYAAAKPFGGRIGPILFGNKNDGESVIPRDANFRSAAYLSGINLSSTPSAEPDLMPTSSLFWVKGTSDAVGGIPISGAMQNLPSPICFMITWI